MEIWFLAGVLGISIALRLGLLRYVAPIVGSECSYWLRAMALLSSFVRASCTIILGGKWGQYVAGLGLRPPHSYLTPTYSSGRCSGCHDWGGWPGYCRPLHHNYLKTSSISTAPFYQYLYIFTSTLTDIYKCVDISLISASREMQRDVTMIS